MDMTLLPDRLIKIRVERGLNKAEASRLLGLSKWDTFVMKLQSERHLIRPSFSSPRSSGLLRNTLPVSLTTPHHKNYWSPGIPILNYLIF